jgi:hypothetical protein
VNDVANDLQVRNSERLAQWAVRWSRQGGSKFWGARPLADLRDQEDHRRYRVIDGKRRQLKRAKKAKVINIAHERIERTRRKARVYW